jgi:Arc/MetJ family transcription regulator
MKTTLHLDDGLIEEARRLTGVRETTALVHRALEELIARESARRLAALAGSMPKLRPIPRRRSKLPA